MLMMIALVVLMAGTALHPVLVTADCRCPGSASRCCITPITSLAMSSVEPRARAWPRHHERATRDRLDPWVRGHGIDLSAWLGATPTRDLAAVVKDPVERAQIAQESSQAPARARTSRRSRRRGRPQWRAEVRDVAEADFVTGMRVSLSSGDRAARDRVCCGSCMVPARPRRDDPRCGARSGCGERALAGGPKANADARSSYDRRRGATS
jgi:hypothetical protein